jgi:hypothetical protein
MAFYGGPPIRGGPASRRHVRRIRSFRRWKCIYDFKKRSDSAAQQGIDRGQTSDDDWSQ